MSRTQQEKQQVFREKLQAEGADAFADGPRPWEQWDESGNQDNDRIWEGSARRIYPKQQARRSIGDRLLSGLAVVALAGLVVGIAGVYLSTTSTPQLASSAIHPAPIVTDRQTSTDADTAAGTTSSLASLETRAPAVTSSSAIQPTLIGSDKQATSDADTTAEVTASLASLEIRAPAVTSSSAIQPTLIDSDKQATSDADTTAEVTASLAKLETRSPAVAGSSATQPVLIDPDRQVTTDEDTAADTTASLASLETLSPPAAGGAVTPAPDKTILEPALQPAAVASTAHIDRVAVETVITETAVTTTVYTQQPSQDQPELVAIIKTTPPPFTSEGAAEKQDLVVASAQQNASTEAFEQAAEAVMVAEADVVATEAIVEEPPVTQTTTAVVDEQASAAVQTSAAQSELPLDKAVTAGTPATIAMNNSPATVEATPDIAAEIETSTETPLLPEAKTGKWVINISSYNRKSAAERMLAVFKKKGIDGEVFTTMINDKAMHRIRVAGFQSSRSAKAEIPAIEQTLGLEGVWVSRR
jgi:hypothetical protein